VAQGVLCGVELAEWTGLAFYFGAAPTVSALPVSRKGQSVPIVDSNTRPRLWPAAEAKDTVQSTRCGGCSLGGRNRGVAQSAPSDDSHYARMPAVSKVALLPVCDLWLDQLTGYGVPDFEGSRSLHSTRRKNDTQGKGHRPRRVARGPGSGHRTAAAGGQ